MVATLEAVWDRGHVVFGAACYMHGLLTSPDWQTLEVVSKPELLINRRELRMTRTCSRWKGSQPRTCCFLGWLASG